MSGGLEHYRRLFGQRAQLPIPRFGRYREVDSTSLPTTLQYLSRNGLLIGKPRGGEAQIRCPAHKGGDERHPSMSVRLVDGAFYCHACHVGGRSIVKLHMLRKGQSFGDALRDLGGRLHD